MAQVASPLEANPGNSRTIMSGFPGYPHGRPSNPPAVGPYTNQLQLMGYPALLDQTLAPQQLSSAQPNSPRSKAIYGSSPSDVQLRRDIGSSSGAGLTPSHALLQQLQQQLGGSSGPGSDTAGSVQHQSQYDEAQKPVKRGRGRQRKNTGVETAQQVSCAPMNGSTCSLMAHCQNTASLNAIGACFHAHLLSDILVLRPSLALLSLLLCPAARPSPFL